MMRNRAALLTVLQSSGPSDIIPPTCTLASTALDLVTGAFTVTATLSEASTDFTDASLTLTNCTVGIAGSGTSYTITVTPTADGTASVLAKVGGFHDAAGNANTEASNTISRIYLSTLAQWYRSDMGLYKDAGKTTPATADDDLVYTWDNLVTGNDLVQATEASRFKLKIVAGAHFVRNDGSDDFMTTTVQTSPATDASITIFIVGKSLVAPTAATRCVFQLGGNNAELMIKNTAPAGFHYWREQDTTGLPLGGTVTNLNYLNFVYSALDSCAVRLNGGAPVTFDPDNAYSTGELLQLGRNAADANFDYMEIIRCTSALDDTTRAAVEAYLAARVANPT